MDELNKIRVLLVDDHVILRDSLQAMLSLRDDMEVIGGAGDGAQALDFLQRHEVDVVVMDMAMPGMGGLEATRRIINRHPHIKILVLSQHDDERYVIPVIQAGASGYCLKRSASNELISAIQIVAQGGSFLPPAIADKVLRAFRSSPHKPPIDEEESGMLTEREREVLVLVAGGRTSDEIASLLYISKKTVMCHRANIYKKLGTHKSIELIKYANLNGLIQLE